MSKDSESQPNNGVLDNSVGKFGDLANYPDFATFKNMQAETGKTDLEIIPTTQPDIHEKHQEREETEELIKSPEKKLGVEVMELSPNDNFEQVAEALYLVDQYIFPDLFDNAEKAKVLTKELFSDNPDALFSFKKTLVAKDDEGNVVGIAVYRDGKCTPWDTESVKQRFLSTGLELPKQFDRANEQYMKKITDADLPEGAVEIEFVGVREEFRANGIGGLLMKTIMDDIGYTEAHLDVLDSHPGARKLYDKLGFKPVGEKFGNYPDGSEGVQHMIRKKE